MVVFLVRLPSLERQTEHLPLRKSGAAAVVLVVHERLAEFAVRFSPS
jgi:competence protein ComGC